MQEISQIYTQLNQSYEWCVKGNSIVSLGKQGKKFINFFPQFNIFNEGRKREVTSCDLQFYGK